MNIFERNVEYRLYKREINQLFKFIFAIIGLILLVDFMGAIAWIASGQCPTGNWYIGTITIHLLRFIFR